MRNSLPILVLVVLAGLGANATTFTGGVASIDTVVKVPQLKPTSSMKLEDGVAPELAVDLEVHRRILARSVGMEPFNSDRQVCGNACSKPG